MLPLMVKDWRRRRGGEDAVVPTPAGPFAEAGSLGHIMSDVVVVVAEVRLDEELPSQ